MYPHTKILDNACTQFIMNGDWSVKALVRFRDTYGGLIDGYVGRYIDYVIEEVCDNDCPIGDKVYWAINSISHWVRIDGLPLM